MELYDIGKKYPETIEHLEWAMDLRHVYLIYNILLMSSFHRVIEIGSHFGFSTTAFVEALTHGCIFDFHVCDIKIEQSVYNLSRICDMTIHECKSTIAITNNGPFDLALLDASHISEDVEDEFELLSMDSTSTYILHDSNTQLLEENRLTPWYDGPLFLKQKLNASPDWYCLEDCKKRIDERTDRGLFFATKNIDLYERAKLIFKEFDNALLETFSHNRTVLSV